MRALRRRAPIGVRSQLLTSRSGAPLSTDAFDGGACRRGAALGSCTRGGTFRFDPFDAYGEGLVTNPNVLVAGQVGRGKSSLVKVLVLRAATAGRRCVVVDPKGEYAPIAGALGVEPIALKPGGALTVNPLDGAPDDPARPALLCAIVAAGLERRLEPAERASLCAALSTADARGRAPTLRDVLSHLLEPDARAAAELGTTPDGLRAEGRSVAMELRRLVDGELRGMFDGPTSRVVALDGQVVVLDVSGALVGGALPVVVSGAAAALESARRASGPARTLVVLDEAWSLLANESVARWLQSSFKLARSSGTAHLLVLHRLSDLAAAGADGSVASSIAAGLLRDVETSVLFAQATAEGEDLSGLMGLTEAERQLVQRLERGVALWRVGDARSVVRHALGPHEARLVDTDRMMRG